MSPGAFRRILLDESHGRRDYFRCFLDLPKLRLIPRDILTQRPPYPFCVTWAHDHALQQLPLRAVRKNINKVQRELFQVVVNHHQVTVFALQLFFVRLDLNLPLLSLPLRRPLIVHVVLSPIDCFHAAELVQGITATNRPLTVREDRADDNATTYRNNVENKSRWLLTCVDVKCSL
jgi:hypothetical protein